ncbi:MAG: rod shape-determining protein MreC [Clostridia bacterium]|nr:rod shape-determining protein MreC [Clostridia bacterium]
MNKKKTGLIGIVITIIILVILVFVSNMNLQNLSYIENIVSTVVMPVQNGLTYLKNKITGNHTFFENINQLQQENEELRTKNADLEKQLREFEIIKNENTTLKEYLALTEQYGGYETKAAYIINKDFSNYNNVFIINVGEKDGIKPNMTVISEKGLVGYVISTTNSTAKVQTIIDTASTVSTTLSSSKDNLICKGTLEETGVLRASYIPTTAILVPGDKIETSGMGGIYPKGILVGTVKKVMATKNIVDRYAIIEPAVDFNKVDTVLVIVK